MELEAVVLTGGSSKRMGLDKSKIQVAGEANADRISRLIKNSGIPVTILGPDGMADLAPGAGPLAALAEFKPSAELIFVAACDMPLFQPKIVPILKNQIGERDAAMPVIDGRVQPFCGLFTKAAILKTADFCKSGEARVMKWVDSLDAFYLDENELTAACINPNCVKSANTPEEWEHLISNSEAQPKLLD